MISVPRQEEHRRGVDRQRLIITPTDVSLRLLLPYDAACTVAVASLFIHSNIYTANRPLALRPLSTRRSIGKI